jgi:hypothetical protein
VFVYEIALAAPVICHDHIGSEYSFLDDLWVEFHLCAGDRVDKWRNELVKCVDDERNVKNEGQAEAFGVMSLKNVKDLGRLVRV